MLEGHHEIRALPAGDDLRLRAVSQSARTGLSVATAGLASPQSQSRGTSCAAALVTRSLLNSAATLTEEDGPYEGRDLSRNDLALLTRALAINAARWPDTAKALYAAELAAPGGRFQQAAEEVARQFGYGFLDPELMREAPASRRHPRWGSARFERIKEPSSICHCHPLYPGTGFIDRCWSP